MNENLKSGRERRIYPRIRQQLPLKVAADGYSFATSTQDVSCIGAYCQIAKYIPPFTKVMVKLDLPKAAMECTGVIVRTDDKEDKFNIAIFFNQITETQRNRISRYLNRFLPQEAAA
ncbi:MAG: PilZ domain-containing protein [Candidatus Omnitrophica bacterium]|nr:PilZ domain-containing protein [Candidatus Omnitrophota bacterium]